MIQFLSLSQECLADLKANIFLYVKELRVLNIFDILNLWPFNIDVHAIRFSNFNYPGN
jgi:hypothetical protein